MRPFDQCIPRGLRDLVPKTETLPGAPDNCGACTQAASVPKANSDDLTNGPIVEQEPSGNFRNKGDIITCVNRGKRVLLIFCFAIVVTCVRIRHEPLGWGGYWSVDIVAPWHR
jgi:hypothetical protein